MARLTAGAAAPDIVVMSPQGPVHLADTWRDGAVVLAFLRHFG